MPYLCRNRLTLSKSNYIMASVIEQLTALLQKNPTLVTQLTQIGSIDEAVKLVKSKGLEIAKAELQEYMVKNLGNSLASGDAMKNLAGGVAGNLLKGMLGKK